jgi:hypothetical protein
MDYSFEKEIIEHYKNNWNNLPKIEVWDNEKENKKIDNFKVLEFSPTKNRDMWTYATCGMSTMDEEIPIELHIFSRKQDKKLVELLTVIAYYHRENNLGLFHTVNFGESWQGNSKCTYGLISLPYLDGPTLENLYLQPIDENLKFYWLIPIYENEVEYKKKYGIEKLENKFDETSFNYLDPNRNSVVVDF